MARIILAIIALTCLSPLSEAQEFHNYPCTDDCSGHEAGYEWAQRKSIDDVDDCSGNSNSFIEGCQAYVEEEHQDEEDEQPKAGSEEE